jgi:glycerate 2-kinase
MNLRDALARALASIDLRARVRVALAGRRPRRIVAIGKAASAMIEGARDVCDDSLEAALVVLPDAAPAPRDDARVRVLCGAHPLPDARSVAAGYAALSFGADLALISGGASSLVFVPVGDLEAARGAFTALLASGADVRAINVVRRHASLAHGGRLGVIDTFIASDVIGGEPHDIGGGPTVPDPTTLDEARAVLARYAPSFASLALAETVKPDDRAARQTTREILVAPNALAVALARDLTHARFAARVLAPSTADVDALAAEYVDLARSLAPGAAIVRSAEPSVRIELPAPGAGGRCTHLAALVARDLAPGVTFLAAASDGVDGASGASGAVVSADSFPDRGALLASIAAFDTGPLHLAHGTALPLAPSGINLADVHALVRVA